jgi:hypothetical protein
MCTLYCNPKVVSDKIISEWKECYRYFWYDIYLTHKDKVAAVLTNVDIEQDLKEQVLLCIIN